MLQYFTQGKGTPVILIHGFPNNHTSWEGIDVALAENNTIITVDLPGAGASAGYTDVLSTEMMAKEILHLMNTLQFSKAILIGHSMGGYVAMECLSQFPERILGVSMVHSLASPDTDEKKVMRTKAIDLINKSREGQLNFLKGMAANLFATQFASENPDAIQSIIHNGMELTAYDLSNFYKAIMHRNDRVSILKDNPIPIQWIIGSEDQATPKAIALEQAYLAIINDVKIYNGVGHMSMIEAPERLKNDLSEFCHFCSFYN